MKKLPGNPALSLLAALLCVTPSVFSQEDAAVDVYGDPLPAGARARLGTVRLRHPGGDHIHGVSVTCLAYAADGTRVVSGGGTGTVRIWDAGTGKELQRIQAHQGPVSSVAFSPDGMFVASAGGDRMVASRQGVEGDKTVRVWDAASGRELLTLRGHERRITTVGFSPDGRTLASGSLDGTVRRWSVPSGEPLGSLDGYQGGVHFLAFTPDGAAIATVDGSHHLRIVVPPGAGDQSTRVERVNIALKGRVGPWPNGDVSTFALAPDGLTAVTVDGANFVERSVQLWNLASAKSLPVRFEPTQERPSIPYEAIFSPDGKTLAVRGGAGFLTLWDAATGRQLRTFRGHQYDVSAIAFSPDGKVLASGSDDRTIRFWDPSSGKEIRKAEGHEAWVESIAFSPDGKTVVTVAGDSTLRFWDPATGQSTDVLRQPNDRTWSCQLKFSPEGSYVATTGPAGAIHLWDVGKRRYRGAVPSASSLRGSGSAGAIALSPDGRRIAEARESLRLVDVATGKEERSFPGSPGPVSSMAFTRDGRLLVTTGMQDFATKQSILQFWDSETGRKLAASPFPEPYASALVVSPDGSLVATVAYGATIRLWELATAREVLSWAGPEKGSRAVAFSPDGKLLATGGEDRIVRLWNVVDGSLVATYEGHGEHISSVAFSPDGKTLASASGDTTALLWRVPPRETSTAAPASLSDEAEALWAALGDVTDAGRAYRTVLRLRSAGAPAAAFLRERLLKPSLTPGRLKELLDGLDDAEVRVRDRATAELLASGEDRMLRAVPAEGLSAEARGRLQSVLKDFESPLPKSASMVRSIRAVRVLEALGTEEARTLLEELARLDPASRVSKEAAAALSSVSSRK